jgi:hypothetical protein
MNNKKIFLIVCIFLVGLVFVNLVNAITIKDVSSSPEEIAPGEVASVSIEIENIFEEDIENLKIKLDLSDVPFAPYQSSSEEFLDELDDGDEEKFTFKIIALPETDSGIYKIPVLISYDYEEDNETKEELISITVNSKPELKVSVEDSALIKGQDNEIIIKVINSGLNDVKFVYLETSDSSGIKFLTNKEQYIGDIDSDDFNTVEYRIHLDSGVSSSINLPVILRYKDATNKEYIETKTILLKTYSLKEAQGLGLIAKQSYTKYILVIFLFGGFFAYRTIKKRRLKKKRAE